MAAMKLHAGWWLARMRAMFCLYEKDLDFQLVFVDWLAGDSRSQSLLSLNPFGQVPILEDGDLILFESRAITRYLAEEYAEKGPQLLPCDSKNRAIMSMWMEVEAHQFYPPASTLIKELVVKPLLGQTTNAVLVKENKEKLSKILDAYETRLGEANYLASDSVTLAHLHHLPLIHYLLGTEAKELITSRPNVLTWVEEMRARPAWTKRFSMEDHIIDRMEQSRLSKTEKVSQSGMSGVTLQGIRVLATELETETIIGL